MLLVALTGGIGAGKSSVSARLVERGAVLVDADQVVKDLQQIGSTVHRAMVDRWGDGILQEDGNLDRQAVADIVFADEAELKALNKIVHPAVRDEMARQVEELRETDRVVILDIPLLEEGGAQKRGARATIVVDCPTEVAVERLIEFRGFERADAEARIAAQATREERLALADFVVDNGGDLAALAAEVDRCWSWLQELNREPAGDAAAEAAALSNDDADR
ncbi:MAG: dephospho-CoA kinase [Actinomycetota bacterium]